MKFVDIDVEKLFQLMQEHDISEVNLRNGKISVEVKRNRGNEFFVPDSNKNITIANLETDEKLSIKEQEDENIYLVKAPLVGTFYKASAPDSDPFVEKGDKVKKGDVLCIVEAMKLFNEIESEISGKIIKVLVDDSSPVEFDQPLFLVDPS